MKISLISPQQAAGDADPDASRCPAPTRDAYLDDGVDLPRGQGEELTRFGRTNIQIDPARSAALRDLRLRDGSRQRGSDRDRLVGACIEMHKPLIDHHRGGTFGLHR